MNELKKPKRGRLALAILAIVAISLVAIYPAMAAPPGNDERAFPTLIPGLPYSDSIDTSEATTAIDDPWPGCSGYGVREATVWYEFIADTDMQVTASTARSSYTTILAVYPAGSVTETACTVGNNPVSFQAIAGQNYIIMIAAVDGGPYPPPGGYGGSLSFSLDTDSAPLAYFDYWTLPEYGLRTYYFNNFSYDPTGQGLSAYWDFGDGTTSTEWNIIHQFPSEGTFLVTLTVTTYDGRSASTQHEVTVTPPPPLVADFYVNPFDPSTYDMVNFINWSYDPACYWCGLSAYWEFGDGTTSTEWSPSHQYAAEGDYTVSLTVTAEDGRSTSTTRGLQVRTHDVAISKFSVPQAAKAGQTRSVTVGVRNTRYPEQVEVQLYKSTISGWQWIGSLQQYVPVRPSNRTTSFEFSYTFTPEDAALGTLNFRAVAVIVNARDALPSNNEAISLPTKVSR